VGRKVLIALALFLATAAAGAQQRARGAVDWILLVDTSKSMRGVGDAKDIFGDVKQSLETFVGEASERDTVSIYSFDSVVRRLGSGYIGGDSDRDTLVQLIRSLQAEGNRTHLGAAIAKGLDRSEELARGSDPTRERVIVLFTDGKEDVRGIANPIPIPANVQRVQKSRPWMFFVSMGAHEHEPQLDAFVSDPAVRGRAKVLRRTDARAIRQASSEVRTMIEPPAAPVIPPTPAVLRVAPKTLDFGSVERGGMSREYQLLITSDQPRRLTVSLDPSESASIDPQDFSASSSSVASVKLRLRVSDDAKPVRESLTVRVAAAAGETRPVVPAAIDAAVVVTTPSALLRALKWAIAIAVLLLLAIGALVLYSGRMPGEMLQSFLTRDALEGELEILVPRTPADAAFVGLPQIRKKQLALSSIVSPEALGGSDARLFCRRTHGEKKIWIAADHGTLRVNDIELPMAELYDSDLIRVGDATLRFNHAGHDRPSSDSFEH
jgi:hypothetical protein